jgi:hypothetical protein
MTRLTGLLLATVFGLGLTGTQAFSACTVVNEFEGLIFDAGGFPASENMESHLDRALQYGVEKVVLFPHPASEKGNKPSELEEIFPDLVVRGFKPWSNAPAVIWPEPISHDMLGSLEAELERHSDRFFLLGNVMRFDLQLVIRLAENYKNLWIGFGAKEVEALNKSCAEGPLGELMDVAPGRFVFSSYGADEGWKNYRWTISKLKKALTYLPSEKADALAYRNAEGLYDLAVNAP